MQLSVNYDEILICLCLMSLEVSISVELDLFVLVLRVSLQSALFACHSHPPSLTVRSSHLQYKRKI